MNERQADIYWKLSEVLELVDLAGDQLEEKQVIYQSRQIQLRKLPNDDNRIYFPAKRALRATPAGITFQLSERYERHLPELPYS